MFWMASKSSGLSSSSRKCSRALLHNGLGLGFLPGRLIISARKLEHSFEQGSRHENRFRAKPEGKHANLLLGRFGVLHSERYMQLLQAQVCSETYEVIGVSKSAVFPTHECYPHVANQGPNGPARGPASQSGGFYKHLGLASIHSSWHFASQSETGNLPSLEEPAGEASRIRDGEEAEGFKGDVAGRE